MKTRVGIIGAGKIGRIHAQGYSRLAEVSITAVADTDQVAGIALAKEHGAEYYQDYTKLLAQELDAVSVGVPDVLHYPVAIASALAGKHILLEKPMCGNLAEADEIIQTCRVQGVKLMMGFRHRFHTEIQTAKRLIDDGRLGRISLVLDASSGGGSAGTGAWTPWYWDPRMAVGGVLTSAGIHGIDRLLWLVGSGIQQVHSYMGTFNHDGTLEDNLVASIRFESGVIGAMVQNFNFYELPSKYDLEIYGTEGFVRIRTGKSVEFGGRETHFVETVQSDDPFGKEVAEFVSAIREDRQPAVTGEDGKAALAVALAMYRSAGAETPVTVENTTNS